MDTTHIIKLNPREKGGIIHWNKKLNRFEVEASDLKGIQELPGRILTVRNSETGLECSYRWHRDIRDDNDGELHVEIYVSISDQCNVHELHILND